MSKILETYKLIMHILKEQEINQGELTQLLSALLVHLNDNVLKHYFEIVIKEGEKRDIKKIVEYLNTIKCPNCEDNLYISSNGVYCVECGYAPGDKI